MPSNPDEYADLKFRVNRDRLDLYRIAAQERGVSLAAWCRQVLTEELERQAALILYQVRAENPHELNAIVEHVLRQRAEAETERLERIRERRRADKKRSRERRAKAKADERAAEPDSTGTTERAATEESTAEHERAVSPDSTVSLERAEKRDSAVLKERATQAESTVPDERAGRDERTDGAERTPVTTG